MAIVTQVLATGTPLIDQASGLLNLTAFPGVKRRSHQPNVAERDKERSSNGRVS
jgi:hypothetical protein